MKKTPKTSRAIREIVVSFNGLLPAEQHEVLHQLGLQREPEAVALAAERGHEERNRVMASTSSDFDITDIECAPGQEAVNLPHPDLMTEEERATYCPRRPKKDDGSALGKAPTTVT